MTVEQEYRVGISLGNMSLPQCSLNVRSERVC